MSASAKRVDAGIAAQRELQRERDARLDDGIGQRARHSEREGPRDRHERRSVARLQRRRDAAAEVALLEPRRQGRRQLEQRRRRDGLRQEAEIVDEPRHERDARARDEPLGIEPLERRRVHAGDRREGGEPLPPHGAAIFVVRQLVKLGEPGEVVLCVGHSRARRGGTGAPPFIGISARACMSFA